MANIIVGGSPVTPVYAEATLGAFVTEWRNRLGDALTPYLWSNDEIVGYLNDALAELSLEVPLIEDSSSSICSFSLAADQETVAISPRVTAIHSARLGSGGLPLRIMSVHELDAEQYNWRDQDSGTPLVFAFNPSGDGTGFIYPPTEDEDTLYLVVNRLPISDLTWDGDQNTVIGIPSRFHRLLIDGVLYRAYQKNDTDTEDKGRSKMHFDLWEKSKETIRRSIVKYRYTDKTASPKEGFI